jgi:hypothetical protein
LVGSTPGYFPFSSERSLDRTINFFEKNILNAFEDFENLKILRKKDEF